VERDRESIFNIQTFIFVEFRSTSLIAQAINSFFAAKFLCRDFVFLFAIPSCAGMARPEWFFPCLNIDVYTGLFLLFLRMEQLTISLGYMKSATRGGWTCADEGLCFTICLMQDLTTLLA
jgi:hypothetical protein